jgi:hypothetical protein
MRTNVVLDSETVAELVHLTGQRSKAAAVSWAVREQIRREKARRLCDLFGKIDVDEEAIEALERAEQAESGG